MAKRIYLSQNGLTGSTPSGFKALGLDINGNIERTLTLQNAWPADVGEVRLSMDDNESYSTFNVAIEYSGYVL
jgi:hypothetical protein